MLEIFAEVFDDMAAYQSKVASEAYLQSRLDDENFIALAALVDGRAVGALAAYVLKKFEQERSEIYIYDLGVLEKYRRCGIATALINYLREIAREIGAYVIFVQADQGDEPAIKLYESLGKREDVHHFDILP
jgi:aminoglycoside 3-N-acetyltransferase I